MNNEWNIFFKIWAEFKKKKKKKKKKYQDQSFIYQDRNEQRIKDYYFFFFFLNSPPHIHFNKFGMKLLCHSHVLYLLKSYLRDEFSVEEMRKN